MIRSELVGYCSMLADSASLSDRKMGANFACWKT
jgi:hypothetical protein